MSILPKCQPTSYTAGPKQVTVFRPGKHLTQFSCCRSYSKPQYSSYKPLSHYVRTHQTSIHRKHNKRHARKNPLSLQLHVFQQRDQLSCYCHFWQLSLSKHKCKIVCILCNVFSNRKSNHECNFISEAIYLYYFVKNFLGYHTYRIITIHVYKYQDFLKVPYLLCK